MSSPGFDASTQPADGAFVTAAHEVADFSEGVFHGAIENPVNGAVQLVNHAADMHLPELHLVDSERLSRSTAGKIGIIVGTAADVYALSLATGGLGGVGYLASAARMGAVGAVYAGVFQPSDKNSKNFYADRATNAAVSGVTFAGMGAAAAGIDALGVFAVPAARSFSGSIAYGALSGAAGGVAHSEANAIFKEGKAFPSGAAFINDVGRYAAFGAAYGAIGYGYGRLTNPEPQHIKTETRELTLYTDKAGRPVKFNVKVNPEDARLRAQDSNYTAYFSGAKMTDGTWSSAGKSDDPFISYVIPWKINSVERSSDGSVTIDNNKSGGTDRIIARYGSDGKHVVRDLAKERADAEALAVYNATHVKDGSGTITYDQSGQLKQISSNADASGSAGREADLYYNNKGDLSFVELKGAVPNERLVLSADDKGAFHFFKSNDGSGMNSQKFEWKGTITAEPATPGGRPSTLVFKSAQGDTFKYSTASGNAAVVQAIKNGSVYIPGGSGRPVFQVDEKGQASLKGGTSPYYEVLVQDQLLKPGQVAPIRIGDKVVARMDVGDAYPIIKETILPWRQESDGTWSLNAIALKPSTQIDMPKPVARNH